MNYIGHGGLLEHLCKLAIDDSGIQCEATIVFHRVNGDSTEGTCLLGTDKIISIGISIQDYKKSLLSTLFHEIGEATGITHNKAIDFSYEQLSKLANKHRHLQLHRLNRWATVSVLKRHPFNVVLSPDVQISICEGNTIVEGMYTDILPYMDIMKGKIHTDHDIDLDYMLETKGNFIARVIQEI